MFSRRRIEKYTELVRNRIVDITVVHDGQQVTAKAIHRGATYATATERESIYAEIAYAVRRRVLQEEREARAKMLESVLATPDIPDEDAARAAAAAAAKPKPSTAAKARAAAAAKAKSPAGAAPKPATAAAKHKAKPDASASKPPKGKAK